MNKKSFFKAIFNKEMIKMDKRGFELGISTLILMILGVLLLAVLIVFITTGSSGFMDNVKLYFSYSNVDSVVNSCNLAADSNIVYRYCCEKNKVKYYVNGEKASGDFTCFQMRNESFAVNLKEIACEGVC